MRIIILGAGQVGSTVARSLASERNEITVVDRRGEPLHELQAELDIRTVLGHASSPRVMQHAGAADADMVLAVTSSDEVNMTACQIAQSLFGIPVRIARVRAPDYHAFPALFAKEAIPIDVLISPERVVTGYLQRLIEFPSATQVLELAGGRLHLVGLRADTGGPMVGHALADLAQRVPGVETRVAALFRGQRAIRPEGDTVIENGDEVFFVAARRHIRAVADVLHSPERPNRRVVIAGGGNIGQGLAEALDTGALNVKVIELDRARAQSLAETLRRVTVLAGDATDRGLLVEEDVDRADVFCSLTNNEEANIMSAMLAKSLGARRVVALVNRPSYVDLVEGGIVDIVVSPHQATIAAILPHVRRGDVLEAHPLRRGAAEALVAVAHGDRRTSQVVGRAVEALALPPDTTVGALIRAGEVIIAHHDTVIESDDQVVLFVADRTHVPRVERLFQVGARFL